MKKISSEISEKIDAAWELTLSSLNLPLPSSSTTSRELRELRQNCCRNSRLVVDEHDEDNLKWMKNIRKLPCIENQIQWKLSF